MKRSAPMLFLFAFSLLTALAAGFLVALFIMPNLSDRRSGQLPSPSATATPDNAIIIYTPVITPETLITLPPEPIEGTSSPVEEIILPLKGLVIGIDPGHQSLSDTSTEPNAPGSTEMKMKDSGGTQGRWTGTPEYQVNLDVSLLLRDVLEEQGAAVVMTREINEIRVSNIERAEIFNEAMTDYALRIHCNGSLNPSDHGAFILVPQTNPFHEDCTLAAQILIDAFCENTGAKNMGFYYSSDMTGFNWSERMVILIEMGHMTNEAEDYKLSDPEYQALMVQGILNGILEYFEIKSKAD